MSPIATPVICYSRSPC